MRGRRRCPYPATRRRAGDERGFTVIEVLFALTLLTLVLLGVAGIITGLSRTQLDTSTRVEAAMMMHQILEDARIVPYGSLGSGSMTRTATGGVRLTASWTVTEVVTGKLKRVDFRVVRSNSPNLTGGERAVRVFYANRDP